MAKNVVAGVAGVLIAMGLVWFIEMLGHSVYPPPADLDFSDSDAVRSYVSGLPLGAFLFVGGAWFAGAFGGTIVACRVGSARPGVFATLVGGLMLLATAFNLAMIPHPLWFSISGIAGIICAVYLGMFLSKRSKND